MAFPNIHNIFTVTFIERDWQPLTGYPRPKGRVIEAKLTSFYDVANKVTLVAHGKDMPEALENLAKAMRGA